MHVRALVRAAYSIEEQRIGIGNTILEQYRVEMGQDPGTKMELAPETMQVTMDELAADYKKKMDGIKAKGRKVPNQVRDGIFDLEVMQALMNIYLELESIEKKSFGRLDSILKPIPIYEAFMKPIRGLGPKICGVLISEIDIEVCTTPSKLWQYAGVGVGPDGRGMSRREEHLVDREYTKKDGTPGTRRGIVFNPFLKTKLYVMATVFMKQGRRMYTPEQMEERKAIRELMVGANPLRRKAFKDQLLAMVAEGPYGNKYGKIFDDYKNRLEHHDKYGVHRDEENIKNRRGIPKLDGTPGKYSPKLHRQNMSMRYMIKMFLLDLWKEWRTIEGLTVIPPYSEAKLGMAPHHVSTVQDIAPGFDVFPEAATQEVDD